MADESKLKPPYVPFGTFKNFAETFRDKALPDVIDRSLMRTYSGTVQSMLTTALRSMGFIDENGAPTERFRQYISGEVGEQKNAIRDGLMDCYQVVFSHQTPLEKMTQNQFDNALRDEFEFTASTLDKAASFFLAACSEIGVEVGPYLSKRKAIAKRKRKERNSSKTADVDANNGPKTNDEKTGEAFKAEHKPLQYQLVDLISEPDFADEHKQAVWALVQYLASRQK